MSIDNSKTIISGRIKFFAATVIFLAYIVLAYIANVIKFPLLGISDTAITLVLAGIYLILAFYPMALNHQYIIYSDDEDIIKFRYFSAGLVHGKKNSVEISKANFAGYRVDKRFFGLISSITLFQQMPQGIAKYPPVYISNLTKKERSKILNSLYQHTPHDAEEVKK